MDDWVAFLNARLDKDEARAKGWAQPGGSHWPWVETRILREVAAMRAILADYLKAAGIEPDDYSEDPACTDALLTALGHHMAVWDDHPDYPAARKSLKEAYWTP